MIGRVRLRVADLEGVRSYYERTIGLKALADGGDTVTLGADTPLVELIGDPGAPPAPPGSTGLFHLAILAPDRRELARSIQRVVGSGERFTGASDHFVSEALYLRDPEGNGIEIYRDRPREEWGYGPDGQLRMGTVALDLHDVLREMPQDEDRGMPDGTIMGHVHLHVADLGEAEAFYADRLGLDVTVRGYPGALFLSHGGYHHHVGLNTWQGAGGPPPPPGSRGLIDYEVTLPGASEGELTDPSGNGVVVRAA
ncbi:MAG TPA: VOC family protein [Solirubrobacteraceae bacterium]|jgi:catechol 2,3-dioxygenase|nr:VOC family protein [Solirubrobacteraceae bacterium]